MDKHTYYKAPEIWGGIECTINRVGNEYRDQLDLSGHYTRADDISHIASLGISKLRYPILWERHQPDLNRPIDWCWITEKLKELRSFNVEPIAGLLHHGSGPRFTNLTDTSFPYLFADYARLVAEQFPWLEYYTPVNEPLTTARFSGLYGLWYPHRKNEKDFAIILLHEVKAVVLSMQAIRTVNPDAKLLQTEDLSKTYSSPVISYQADFENERRWLSSDLLCGRVNENHFFWTYLIKLGIPQSSLEFFLENVCIPDLLGYNYYPTSERFLNINPETNLNNNGNGRHLYADEEAIRSGHSHGAAKLLKEAWHRYKIPMAITECHLNCTREEQMRWFMEHWDICCSLINDGIELHAITAWSLLGSFDWDSLLTQTSNHYESGVFTVTDNKLRETVLAKLIRSLASGKTFEHPLLYQTGWWKRLVSNRENVPHDLILPQFTIYAVTSDLSDKLKNLCQIRSLPASVVDMRYEADEIINDLIHLRAAKSPWAFILIFDINAISQLEGFSRYCHVSNIRLLLLVQRNYQTGDRGPEKLLSGNPGLLLIYSVTHSLLNEILDFCLDDHTGAFTVLTGGRFIPVVPEKFRSDINYAPEINNGIPRSVDMPLVVL